MPEINRTTDDLPSLVQARRIDGNK